MEDAIQVDNRWYIPATSPRGDDRTRILKSDDAFAVFSRHGEIGRVGLGDQGLYFAGTRHLSRWQVLLAEREPMLLNSTVRLDNGRLLVDQTTPDLFRGGTLWLPKGTLHLRREAAMQDETLSERLQITNYHDTAARLPLEYRFDADFCDVFEVRGVQRQRRGEYLEPHREACALERRYQGLDGVLRRTRIQFSQAPDTLDGGAAVFHLDLGPGATFELEVQVHCAADHPRPEPNLLPSRGPGRGTEPPAFARIFTDNEQFNDWVNRSEADLRMLLTHTRHGLYPYAGLPWFSTPFGRDGLITALQTLWLQPQIARGVLAFLAATQAQGHDDAAEAEPGKILHELRSGEMAALDEVPFRRYYGTVDATPLFVLLAGRYLRRTGDEGFVREIWPALRRALQWMEEKADERGFLTYARHGDKGLVQQGWKDSDDSVFHRDGRPADPPIALCEVQGYACEAFQQAGAMADRLGQAALARRWRARSRQMLEAIDRWFWMEAMGTYALALDGEGRPCAVRTSNAGHLLYNGAVKPARAASLARSLVSAEACNGWGVRTVFAGEPRYNPMSYHNGSVWPHDTSLIAAGLARYGFKEEAMQLLEGLFNASIFFDIHRLPELFCGFDRLPGQAPTLYPVACTPQAWASGAVYMLLEAILGVDFSPRERQIRLRHPRLPDYLGWLRISGLGCGDASLDLVVRRHGRDVAVNVEQRRGDLELSVVI